MPSFRNESGIQVVLPESVADVVARLGCCPFVPRLRCCWPFVPRLSRYINLAVHILVPADAVDDTFIGVE